MRRRLAIWLSGLAAWLLELANRLDPETVRRPKVEGPGEEVPT